MKKGLIGIQMSTIKDKIAELGAYGTLKAWIPLCGGFPDSHDGRECGWNEEGL